MFAPLPPETVRRGIGGGEGFAVEEDVDVDCAGGNGWTSRKV